MTPKQREFARAYVSGNSAIKAAKEAGYTDQYAHSKSHRLLEHPAIINEIRRLRARVNEQVEKSATDVINEFSKIAFTDRIDFLKEDEHHPGEFIYKAPDELSPDQRAIVEKVTYNVIELSIMEEGQPRTVFVKHYSYILSDKSKALEQMGRHFGLFDDKLRLVGNQQNPFKTASPAQLKELHKTYVGIMNDGKVIEGKFKEVKDG
jgi:phage terminase small subunit